MIKIHIGEIEIDVHTAEEAAELLTLMRSPKKETASSEEEEAIGELVKKVIKPRKPKAAKPRKHKRPMSTFPKEQMQRLEADIRLAYTNAENRKHLHKMVRRIAKDYKLHSKSITAKATRMGLGGAWYKTRKIVEQTATHEPPMIRAKPLLPKTLDEQRTMLANARQEVFPDINGIVAEQSKELLKKMVGKMVTSYGLSLTYGVESFLLGIGNIATWRDFCDDFMVKSERIAKFFNVPDKFDREGGIITYGG